MTVPPETPAALWQRVRRESCALLNYDLAALTPGQTVRLDRCVTLRLELDAVAARQLRGDPIDVNRAVAASEALERLLSPSFNAEVTERHTARHALAALVNSLSDVSAQDRDERVVELEAALTEKDQLLAEKNSVISALGGQVAAAPPPPPTPPTPQPQVSSQPPLGPPSSGIPANYLARHDEPWRGFGSSGGRDPWANNR